MQCMHAPSTCQLTRPFTVCISVVDTTPTCPPILQGKATIAQDLKNQQCLLSIRVNSLEVPVFHSQEMDCVVTTVNLLVRNTSSTPFPPSLSHLTRRPLNTSWVPGRNAPELRTGPELAVGCWDSAAIMPLLVW
jgi:hypothetical protein